jgi:hypothetical protein
VLLAMGRLGEAAAAARRAINDARTSGDRARSAVAKVTMARVLRTGKQRGRAVRLLRDAVAGFDRLGMTKESASASEELRALVADLKSPTAAVGD